jgi:dihydropteroate synthase
MALPAETVPAWMRGALKPGERAAAYVYVRPLGVQGFNPIRFDALEVLVRGAGATDGVTGFRAFRASRHDVEEWAWREGEVLGAHITATIGRIAATRPPWAGLDLARPAIMGIVNVTPDSFSDGGETPDAASAIARGLAMAEAGADIVDVGGESTRPGAEPVSEDEELARVLPVIAGLAGRGVRVSVDTRHARVMQEALAAGAAIVNDVSALAADAASAGTVAASGRAVALMHMQGEPGTMQREPRYRDALLDVYDALAERVRRAQAAGIQPQQIVIDPGIGFGKTVEHNLAILGRIGLYHGLGVGLMVGVSRKSWIARVSRGEAVEARLAGSLAAATLAWNAGVQIVRVHDVAETRQALAVWQAIEGAGRAAAAT